MSTPDSFRFDHARHTAAADLRPEHLADFQRLLKTLRYGSRFQLLVAEFNDVPYREALIERIDQVLAGEALRPVRLTLSATAHPEFTDVEAELCRLAADHEAIHLTGGESWFDDTRWEHFNIRREATARGAPVRLILWLTAEPVSRMALCAQDLWAWRSGAG